MFGGASFLCSWQAGFVLRGAQRCTTSQHGGHALATIVASRWQAGAAPGTLLLAVKGLLGQDRLHETTDPAEAEVLQGLLDNFIGTLPLVMYTLSKVRHPAPTNVLGRSWDTEGMELAQR